MYAYVKVKLLQLYMHVKQLTALQLSVTHKDRKWPMASGSQPLQVPLWEAIEGHGVA